MPIVIVDFTNETWATEQPTDGYIHVGYRGKSGPRLKDILDFVSVRQKQFDQFLAKRRAEEQKRNARTTFS